MAAFAAGPKGDSVKREVLGLYDSAFEETPTDTMLHTNVEMPLNHLGYILRYHDLRQGLPPRELAERAVAVVTMFTYEVGDPRAFLTWLEQSADIVPRFISMGQIGANLTEADLTNASARYADFTDAILDRTILRGTDLTGARITADQLRAAVTDEQTILPESLDREL